MKSQRDWAGGGTPIILGILRIAYGILWLQQLTWKLPPDFGLTRQDGLYYWTSQMAKYSCLPPHRFFVESVVLPNFLLFAWLTLLIELLIGVSHLVGVVSRLGALLALAMSTNLLVGLACHPAEWPWSYLMLLGYALLFLSGHPGRVMGLDGWLSRRLSSPVLADRPWARALAVLS